jgi:catechol 2,3-dioxygenase-like lactoylglutathione lyase family enzyme
MDYKLEVVVLPVGDVDRAKQFYTSLEWRCDADIITGPNFRVIQFTPPGFPCSIIFGTGLTNATAGSVTGLHLVVSDIEQARTQLRNARVDVSDVFHDAGGVLHSPDPSTRLQGPHPARESYAAFATFGDPDGNQWWLQEITTRLERCPPERRHGLHRTSMRHYLPAS